MVVGWEVDKFKETNMMDVENEAEKKTVPLVAIQWLDSAQPSSEWQWLSDLDDIKPILCVSVGWLVYDGIDVKAIAPNMAGYRDEERTQASGIIRIPTCSIMRTVMLDDPFIMRATIVDKPVTKGS